jgi:small subunit ribosomal protein S3
LGQKTHPIGFRLGGVHPWQARWFADKAAGYRTLAVEDQAIRKLIKDRYEETGGITRVEIERGTQDLVVSVHTARPGIVIGRGGQRVDELRTELENLAGKRARLNIQEVRNADVDAYLVARNIADQLERRVAYRRAMRLSAQRTMQAGAQGIKIIASGRLGGAEIARNDKAIEGRVPLHTLRANIDFAIAEAATTFGRIGIKVWIYKGDILPEGRAGRTLNVADVVAEQEAASAAAQATPAPAAEAPAGSVAVEIPAEAVAEAAASEESAGASDAAASTDAAAEKPEA